MPILARAEQLDVPIYLHPNLPPQAVRDAYYGGLPGSDRLSSGYRVVGLAFRSRHSRPATGRVRRARPPSQAQADHRPYGRGARRDAGAHRQEPCARFAKHLTRSVAQTILDQVWVTTSGMFTWPPLDVAWRFSASTACCSRSTIRTAAIGRAGFPRHAEVARCGAGKICARQC